MHNRFPIESSMLFKEELLNIPLVNDHICRLYDLIKLGYEKLELPYIQKLYWPNGREFAACLTHDIDTIQKWTPSYIKHRILSIKSLLLNHDIKHSIKEAMMLLNSIITNKNPYWNFEEIMELERSYGFRSSFYFFAGIKNKRYPKSPDIMYSIVTKNIKNIIEQISNAGWEIGLHSGYNSYNTKERLISEKELMEKTLGQSICGVRQHYLRFEVPTTWRIQEDVGLVYDTTLGHAEHIGFRAGICFPFNPYDIQEDRRMNIFEIPLTVMDGTLFEYLGYTSDESWRVIKELIDTVKKYNGLITLLWHNTNFDEDKFPERRDLYERCLTYLKMFNAYVGSCKEIISWWIKRNSLKFAEVKRINKETIWTIYAEKNIKDVCFKLIVPNKHKYSISIRGTQKYNIIKQKNNIIIKLYEARKNEKIELKYISI